MLRRKLLIRADASAEIGIGHVMRCLALAQAWQDAGGEAVFAMAQGAGAAGERLRSEGFEIFELTAAPASQEDLSQTDGLCRKLRTSWLVLDGFHFSREYQRGASSGPYSLLQFDDHAEFSPYRCDVLLNINPYASEDMYQPLVRGTRFLLGPQYALLRREFLQHPRTTVDAPELARKVLITFGGSDPNDVTSLAIEALVGLSDLGLDLTIVVGSSNPHLAKLEQSVREHRNARIVLNSERMPQLMTSADLALSAGGGTCYELAFQRVPMFLITMAQNHQRTVEAWSENGAAINAGWFHDLDRFSLGIRLRAIITDRTLRLKLAANASRMVDGFGANRVVQTIWASRE